MTLPVGDYLAGAAFLALVCGLCAAAGAVAVRRALPGLRGPDRWLAVFTAATGALVWAHAAPGLLGVLTRPAVVVAALVLLAGARVLPRAAAPPAPPEAPPAAAAPRVSVAIAAAGVLAAAAGALGFLGRHAGAAVTGVDAMTMYLPQVAGYLQARSLTGLVQHFPDFATATYPQNGTLLLLASVLPWDSAFAARFVNAPFLAAAAGATYLLARELRAPATTAALAAAAVTVLPAVNQPALAFAQVDAPMLAWFAAGGYFLLRASRSGSRAELVLAGAALGLAMGTKWYALAHVPVVALVWLVARARARERMVQDALALALAVAACSAAWLIRNWAITGNPIYPAPVRLLGITIFDAPRDSLRELRGFTITDYLLDGRVMREIVLPAWGRSLGLLGPLLAAGAAAAALSLLRRRGPGTGAAACVTAAAVVMGVLYTALPDTALGLRGDPVLVAGNARYAVPALLAAAAATAWLAARHPRARLAVELLLLLGVLDGARRSYGAEWPAVAVAAVLLAAAAAVLRRWRPPRAWALAGAGAAALGGGLALSQLVDPAEYGRLDPVVQRVQDAGSSPVALAGRWSPDRVAPVLPAFGPRLGNRVDYMGPFDRGTRRPHAERAPFLRQLRDGRFDLLVVGKDDPPAPGGEQPEAGWAESAGFRRVAESPHLVLLRAP